ncbi:hypothetical protein [Vibrio hippocampi]|uniref:Uncharacterized protein n=1 Tax=Vibrio hippocampi TaxID=654686 RepID=A0ABN8DES9_9VIBR|nr:hypothetical protein [Vibrio hippocampi]CAH0525622.1 hypothetical protein VHP8226_01150 [Vibrio hippocampi]
MYKYVAHKLDTEYIGSLPDKIVFNVEEIPVEEIEIREMICAWYETGFIPATETSNHDAVARLKKLESTLLMVLKNPIYRAAYIRVLTTLKPKDCTVRLQHLLELSQNKTITH